MDRKRKAFLTSVTSLAYQVLTILCGLILPRCFLSKYGSSVNGLVSSITQFLGFISLAECGVGTVVRAALYKPLAEKNHLEISKIIKSSNSFFHRILIILLVYTVGLMIVYPCFTIERFDFWFTSLLIAIISIGIIAQNYLCMSYRLLLSSDQMGFIILGLQCLTMVANTLLCVVLIRLNAGIHTVKLISATIFFCQPFIISAIVKRKYKIDTKIVLNEEPIKQKWNGFAQHIASVVLANTDVVVLTVLSTLENVSIYSVYNLIVNGVRNLVDAFTNGIQALLGNMLAKKEYNKLNETFSIFEWGLHTVTTLFFSITAILIVPFIAIYTKNVTDANYINPLFGLLLTLSQAIYCIRLPYSIMIVVAGHFKQTQWSAIVEVIINIFVSVVLVFFWGLIGVAIGTIMAMLYRSVYFAWYLSKHILKRDLKIFLGHILIDIFSAIIAALTSLSFVTNNVSDYWSWFILAIKVGGALLVETIVINLIFYPRNIKKIMGVLKNYHP